MPEARVTEIFKVETSDTKLHAEFSSLARDVEIQVEGGELLSSEIYGRAADMELSPGPKTITVTGVPLSESNTVLTWNYASTGEIDIEDNPLITDQAMAAALAEHVKNYLSMRNTYTLGYRGDPALESGDVIGLQTRYTPEMDALVLRNELSFDGTLDGKLILKGLI